MAGDSVLVLDGGTVALYAIYWARRPGAGRIVAMLRSAPPRTVPADGRRCDEEVGAVVEALGGSPDIVFECVGSEGMLGKAVRHARIYGSIVSLGFCTAADPVMPAMTAYKWVTMQLLAGYAMRVFRYVADQLDKGIAISRRSSPATSR